LFSKSVLIGNITNFFAQITTMPYLSHTQTNKGERINESAGQAFVLCNDAV